MPIRFIDSNNPTSLAGRFRMQRFALFQGLVHASPSPVSILDLGGTVQYWQHYLGLAAGKPTNIRHIHIVNLPPLADQEAAVAGVPIRVMEGDATALRGVADESYDIAYSNSVIEHVGDRAAQLRMAQEVRRVARGYFVQTPNYWFPFEPHFQVPGFQYLPLRARAALHRRFNLGYLGKQPDPHQARADCEQIRLLGPREFSQMFYDGRLIREKVLFLDKSLIAVKDWAARVS